jgi:hypothetical protein
LLTSGCYEPASKRRDRGDEALAEIARGYSISPVTIARLTGVRMRRVLIVFALLVGGSPLSAEPTDPYAGEQAAIYKQMRAEYLDTVRTLYFAVGCKVVNETGVSSLIMAQGIVVNQEAVRTRPADTHG